MTPTTSLDCTAALLGQMYGIAGACCAIEWLMAAHALLRPGPTDARAALFIASLIDATLSCGQLLLPCWLMLLPLKVASSIACGSAKSRNQPTFGQIGIFWEGTPQNFVNSVS